MIALVDTGWNTVVSYAYDSWGNVTAIEGDQDLGKKNPLRYRGYYWDEETGLYYLQADIMTRRLDGLSMRMIQGLWKYKKICMTKICMLIATMIQ